MSVPVRDRTESKVQFLMTAFDLEVYTIQSCSKFPKHYRFSLAQVLEQLSISILNEVKSANSVFVTNEYEAVERVSCWTRANNYLQCMISQLEVSRNVITFTQTASGKNTTPSDYYWQHWYDLIDKEIKLVSAMKKADKERYSTYLQNTNDG